MRYLNPVLISTLILCIVNYINGGILDNIKDGVNDAVDETNNALTETTDKICITDSGCNTSFLNINNYCCTMMCCNMFEYVSKNDSYWDNFSHIFSSPRAINIIIIVAMILALASVIGILVKLACCLCCGCCGSKKYVIVGNS
jgi:hypothetical protein